LFFVGLFGIDLSLGLLLNGFLGLFSSGFFVVLDRREKSDGLSIGSDQLERVDS
jgi:hypothetical protein